MIVISLEMSDEPFISYLALDTTNVLIINDTNQFLDK